MKIALRVEYTGTHFYGWQAQPNQKKRTAQQTLEVALSKVAGGSAIKTYCGGRTDAGVHAAGQVVHFETLVARPDTVWLLGTNHYLPSDIRVCSARQVSDDFHARFSAKSRSYRYSIDNHPLSYRAHLYPFSAWVSKPLKVDAMHEAIQFLLGEQDFSSFRSAGCQSHSPVRRVIQATVSRSQDNIFVDITANSFLYRMVRNIVGSLIEVGKDNKPIDWLQGVLQSRNRSQALRPAVARGLCLVNIEYEQLI